MLKNIWYCIKKTSEWYFAANSGSSDHAFR